MDAKVGTFEIPTSEQLAEVILIPETLAIAIVVTARNVSLYLVQFTIGWHLPRNATASAAAAATTNTTTTTTTNNNNNNNKTTIYKEP